MGGLLDFWIYADALVVGGAVGGGISKRAESLEENVGFASHKGVPWVRQVQGETMQQLHSQMEMIENLFDKIIFLWMGI